MASSTTFVSIVIESNNQLIFQTSNDGVSTGSKPDFSSCVADAILAESATISNTYRQHLGWVLTGVKYTVDGALVSIWEH